MFTLIEVGPQDLTRSLQQMQPGIFATGRELEVTRDQLVNSPLTPAVVACIINSGVAWLERPIFELFLPQEDKAEKKDGVEIISFGSSNTDQNCI